MFETIEGTAIFSLDDCLMIEFASVELELISKKLGYESFSV
jgi:hypothetical protein